MSAFRHFRKGLALVAGLLGLLGHGQAAVIPLSVPKSDVAGFTTMSPGETGVVFTNLLARSRSLTNSIYLNGSGVAAGDVDGDGWCDLYFCGLDGPNVLYRNLGGWKFAALPEAPCEGLDATGAAFADFDGDGDLDLAVNSVKGGTHLFLNDGKGHFSAAPGSPLNLGKGGTSLAFGDIDGNGTLDLYAANYRTSALMDLGDVQFGLGVANGVRRVTTVNGRPATDPEFLDRFFLNEFGRISEAGEADALYLNEGGNWTLAPFTGGAFQDEHGRPLSRAPFDWGLSVMFRDLNGDGWPDIYVANDFDTPDRVWINQGRGKFRELALNAMAHTSLFSMGADVADINRDGLDDIFVLDMLSRDHRLRMTTVPDRSNSFERAGLRPQYMMNTLQLNRGDGTYAEIAQFAGVAAAEWAWAAVFLDVDLDGYEDLLITNGNEADGRDYDASEKIKEIRTARKMEFQERMDLRRMYRRLDTPNAAFRNRGGLEFEDASDVWQFNHTNVGNGMALADLDNDGDMDVVINNLNAGASLLRNNSGAPRVAVRLKGQGIGARIKVEGGPVVQTQEMIAGGRYLSGDQALRTFAAGASNTIEVRWPGGRTSRVANVPANSLCELAEPEQSEAARQEAGSIQPLFEDLSGLLGHIHADDPFDDFARQPLLPRRLSHQGPPVIWTDLNKDGFDDLIIGASKGGRVAAFENVAGNFKALKGWDWPITRDVTSIATGGGDVFLAFSNNEDGLAAGAAVRKVNRQSMALENAVPCGRETTGPIAVGDVNRDSIPDLFVGGRSLPGKYPAPAASRLLRGTSAGFELEQTFDELGMVTGAVFADLNKDGAPDLLAASEWGPVRVFINIDGKLTDRSEALGLGSLKGWWSSIATGDFNKDGRLDFVAGNWGRNSRYQANEKRPERIYYLDVDGDGANELIEAHFDPAQNKIVPRRNLDTLGLAIPSIREQFITHAAFASASVQELLGDKFRSARELSATTLETTLFINRGDRFEAMALPHEAQLAPVNGIAVADFDGDGNEDIFLAQNFYGSQPEIAHGDAGLGLILRGDGAAHFRALSGAASGVRVAGEQNGCAAADFDRDGRTDLVVTVYRGGTKLFRNALAPIRK